MAYHTLQGFISAPQSLRRTMLLSIHGQTLVSWLRNASEQWNADALAALSDTVASYPQSDTDFTPVPMQVQALASRLEPEEAGFLLAAVHARLSNEYHNRRWEQQSEDTEGKPGRISITTDLVKIALEVQQSVSTKTVLKVFTATEPASDELRAVGDVAEVHAVYQTYLETMNRHGLRPRHTEFEYSLESLGASIPEISKGLNSLDYLMTI